MMDASRGRARTALLSAVVAACVAAACFPGCVDSAGLSDAKCLAVCGGVCVDPQSDRANCGTCGNTCPSGALCAGGQCTTTTGQTSECTGGTTACGTACVDTKVDPAHCGECGKACATGQICSASACACPASAPNFCGAGADAGADAGAGPGAVCTDLETDPAHCGDCATACGASQVCIEGACVSAGTLQTLSLLAGQLGSSGNLDGTGTAARFNGPWGSCWDGGQNLYIADTNNCVIRKVVIATGATTTFAGTPNACGELDGVGFSARLYAPTGCAMDGAGNMYVTDRSGCTVRKIELATANVTTVAGSVCGFLDGMGTAARFNSPHAVSYDGAANLYVSDTSNHAIRKIEIATGAVTTFAGAPPPTAAAGSNDDASGTSARFSSPHGSYLDATAGVIYVADYANHTIRRVNLATSAVDTVVGLAGSAGATNGTGTAARLRNPIGLAYDGTASVYVTEDGNHDIRVVALADFAVTSNAGAALAPGYLNGTGTGALFFNPRGITFDGSGNYYVGDYSNHSIRKVVAATGAVSIVAGLGAAFGSADGTGPAATFNYVWGLAFDAGTGTLYASDYNTSIIRAVNLASGAVTTLAGTSNQLGNVDGTGPAARFRNPAGIVLDGNGNLYVADRSNHTIRKIVLATGAVTTVTGSAGNAGHQDGAAAGVLFNTPTAIAHDGGNPGKLYVADYNNRVIREVTAATGDTTTLAGAVGVSAVVDGVGTAANFGNVTGIATKGDGKVYVADTNRIRVVDTTTGAVVIVTGGGGYSDGRGALANFNFNAQPAQLSFDAAGNLIVADYNNSLIRSFSPTTLISTTVAGIYGVNGAVAGPLPTSIATAPRAAVAIPGGVAFAASYGLFVVR